MNERKMKRVGNGTGGKWNGWEMKRVELEKVKNGMGEKWNG